MHEYEPVSPEATIIMLQERLDEAEQEQEWLWQRIAWLEKQEWNAWEQVRQLEHWLALRRTPWHG